FRCARAGTLRRGAVRCHSGCSRLDARPHPLRRTTRGRRRARPIPDVPRSSTLGRGQSRGEDNPCCTVVEMITAAAATRRSTTDLSTVRQAGGPVTSCDESAAYYSSIAIAVVTVATSIEVRRELHERAKVLKQRTDLERTEEPMTRLIGRPRH